MAGGIFGKIWDVVTDVGHRVTGIPTAEEKRNAQKAMKEQINAYKEQTEITRQNIENVKNEQAAERRRIEEKQIRSLRRNYRAPSGLLGQGTASQPDMSSKLGG